MRILLSGASGLIGSALEPFLAREGHEVVLLKRTALQTDTAPPSWNPDAGRVALTGAGPLDAVIHLSGETIAQRWTPAAKARIRQSRVAGTRLLCEALLRLPKPPGILICASATGYYGSRGDELLDEQSAPGRDFLAEVCRDWEAATCQAAQYELRVVNLRLGIVLAAEGGALKKMLPAFRLGIGGRLGNGRQYWSWIAMDDLLAVVRRLLDDDTISGPVNAVSPHAVTNNEFTRILGGMLHRPTLCTVPAAIVKLVFGEMGEAALLASYRVRPGRLEQSGFVFQFPDLVVALRHVLGRGG